MAIAPLHCSLPQEFGARYQGCFLASNLWVGVRDFRFSVAALKPPRVALHPVGGAPHPIGGASGGELHAKG